MSKDLYERTLDCVHCGLCLQACPTYDLLGLEPDSPRGRIYLLRALAEGRIKDKEKIRHHFDRCLDCRACETACPSGVEYGKILEEGRERLGPASRLRRLMLKHVLSRPGRLRFAFGLARFGEMLGLRRLAPRAMRELLPRIPKSAQRRPIRGTFDPTNGGDARATVALFTGCVMEQAFGDLNRTTLELLRKQGFRVVVPADQVCCGALHRHDGDGATARRLEETNTTVFAGLNVDAVIHNSAGCGAAMKEYEGELATKSSDVCEFLADQGLGSAPTGFPRPTAVAYDDPCHLCHGQGIRDAPRELLRQVPNLNLVSHDDPESCCGSAGIYNLTQPALAEAIGTAKVQALMASGAKIVATGNPGCLMQIAAHAQKQGSGLVVRHPAELLL